jgi:hypothetical protein
MGEDQGFWGDLRNSSAGPQAAPITKPAIQTIPEGGSYPTVMDRYATPPAPAPEPAAQAQPFNPWAGVQAGTPAMAPTGASPWQASTHAGF